MVNQSVFPVFPVHRSTKHPSERNLSQCSDQSDGVPGVPVELVSVIETELVSVALKKMVICQCDRFRSEGCRNRSKRRLDQPDGLSLNLVIRVRFVNTRLF
jgi:hypothetical protein